MRLLSQSGCSVPAVRAWHLLPVKLGVSGAASATIRILFFFFFLSLSCLGTLGTFSLSFRLFLLQLTFHSFFASLSFRSLGCLRQYRRVPSNKSASPSALRTTRLQTSLLVSVSLLTVLRFAVKCVARGKKKYFLRQKKKNDNLSFFQSRFSACRDGFALCSVTERL